MITLIIWGVAMAAALAAAATAAFLGYQAAGRQMEIDEMLARKHVEQVETKFSSTSSASATMLVKEGAGGDFAKAEEPDP